MLRSTAVTAPVEAPGGRTSAGAADCSTTTLPDELPDELPDGAPRTVNQAERSPVLEVGQAHACRTASPVVVTLPRLPSRTTVPMRPPHSPRPLREAMRSRCRVPTAGNRFSSALAGSVARQSCCGLSAWSSHGSSCAVSHGTLPAAVQPPLLLLNSASTGAPSEVRTTPAVARTAAVVLAGSSSVARPAEDQSRLPPKTWQAVVSQMS